MRNSRFKNLDTGEWGKKKIVEKRKEKERVETE